MWDSRTHRSTRMTHNTHILEVLHYSIVELKPKYAITTVVAALFWS
jgi:hypothetical protein